MAVGKPPCGCKTPAVGSDTRKLPRKKRVRSAPSMLGLGLSLGCIAVARASWVDPDTLPEYRTKEFEGDERQFDLVFSDEFDR